MNTSVMGKRLINAQIIKIIIALNKKGSNPGNWINVTKLLKEFSIVVQEMYWGHYSTMHLSTNNAKLHFNLLKHFSDKCSDLNPCDFTDTCFFKNEGVLVISLSTDHKSVIRLFSKKTDISYL